MQSPYQNQSKRIKKEAKMAEESVKKIIKQLKALKDMKGLTIDDIVDTLDKNRVHIEGVVRKIVKNV